MQESSEQPTPKQSEVEATNPRKAQMIATLAKRFTSLPLLGQDHPEWADHDGATWDDSTWVDSGGYSSNWGQSSDDRY